MKQERKDSLVRTLERTLKNLQESSHARPEMIELAKLNLKRAKRY